jgi:hypothetical protein
MMFGYVPIPPNIEFSVSRRSWWSKPRLAVVWHIFVTEKVVLAGSLEFGFGEENDEDNKVEDEPGDDCNEDEGQRSSNSRHGKASSSPPFGRWLRMAQ